MNPGVISFLKKLGQVLAKGAAIALGVEPLVVKFLGSAMPAPVATAVNDLTAIGQMVVQAEAMLQGSGTGPQKLAAASPLVANIIQTSELMAGKKIANEAAFTAACQKITGDVADLLNSLSPDTIKS